MKENDIADFDRQPHPCGTTGVRQLSDNCSYRFGTIGIVDDSHPFFKFAIFVPGGVLKVAKTAADTPRRFPPPWTAEVTPNCFIVRDANGQTLSYVYYECEPGRRSAAKLTEQR